MASAAPSSDPSQGAGSGPEGNPQGNGNYTNGTGIASQSPNAGSEAANGVAAASAAKYEEKSASSPTNGHSAPPAASKAPMERSPSTSGLPPGAKIDPELKYGFVSGWLFSWVTPLVARCRKGPISLREVHKLPKRMETATCIELFGKFWREELAKVGPEKASPAKALLRAFFWPLALAQVTLIMANAFGMLGPCYFMYNLSQFAADPSMSVGYGIGMAFGFMANNQMMSFFMHKYWIMVSDISSCARSAMIGVIYNKAIALRDLTGLTVGELLNMCTNDSQRVFDAGNFLLFIPASLIFSCAILIYTALLVGPGAILGWAVFMLILPFQAWVARMSAQWRRGALQFTDRRVRLMSEILACIKLIKMYAWELAFSRHVGELRVKERAILQKAAYLQSFVLSLIPVVPVLAGVATFILSGYLNNHLVAADAFTIMALYNALRFIMATVPNAAKSGAEAQVGLKRIKTFLLTEGDIVKFPEPAAADVAIDLQNSVFAWRALSEHKTAEANRQAALGAHTDVAVPLDKAVATAAATAAAVTDTNGAPATSAASAAGSAQGTPSRGASVGGIDGGESETDEVTTDSSLRPQRLPSRRGSASVQVQAPLPPRISEETDVDEAIAKKQALAAEGKIKDIVVLEGINLTVPRGTLVGVCGAVGSGKSSLISAILSQMKVVSGTNHVVRSIAYVAQQAWIQSATLRNNVLFGLPYDEAKYNRVIDICCLRPDLDVLPAGDATEIGERGINLSGGQKQRVSLARALYSDKELYLLDDPLSAVDAQVGRALFENCIRGALRGKTVIFVTHQLQFLSSCDRVLFMDQRTIAEDGPYPALIAADAGFARLMESHRVREKVTQDAQTSATEAAPEAKTKAGPRKPAGDAAVAAGKALVQAEARETGAVTHKTYMTYMRAGGLMLAVCALVFFYLSMGGRVFSDWWLSYWIRLHSTNIREDSLFYVFALVYGMSAVALLILQAIRGVIYNAVTLRASSRLHEALYMKVLRAPMSFFDATPTGRIINRFSKDMDDADVGLPTTLEQFLQNQALILVSIGLVAVVFPWFLIAIVPVFFIYQFIVNFTRPAQRDLKRLDGISRSPLYGHITATLQGLATLHAFDKEQQFAGDCNRLIDNNTRAFFAFAYVGRWFGLRLDIITTLLTGATSFLIVGLRDSISSSLASLALLYTISLSGLFQFTTRLFVESEARFTAIERINQYVVDVPTERAAHTEKALPEHWPQGSIEFDNLVVAYRPELPPALNGVSLSIRPREKIGVAGRTGSGKSTLALSLFRIIEARSGCIRIDGIDIASVGLDDLRSRLAVIPQDPVLFVGTVRYNLDPFGQHSDAAIWAALEQSYLKDAIAALPLALNSTVVENGENFSVGERQLLCLARALLRGSRILILDEATAAIDTRTDGLIQAAIRHAFADCTLITVAHRLDTILDSDRILVLDNGHVAEFDTPQALLANPSSYFAQMVASSQASHGPAPNA
eukprot:m.61122 g.61122  ORF g.61122 m.61122 type:complete len:1476 (-) comp12327_c0_seq4:235-4662(-)